MSNEQFDRLHAEVEDLEHTEALTHKPAKQIHFRVEGVNVSTCRHELWHAYKSTLYLGSTNAVTSDDIEEMEADMLAEFLDVIKGQADRMYKAMREDIENV